MMADERGLRSLDACGRDHALLAWNRHCITESGGGAGDESD
jgi:hypothetical protein